MTRIFSIMLAIVLLFLPCHASPMLSPLEPVGEQSGLAVLADISQQSNPFSINPLNTWGMYLGRPEQFIHTRVYGVISSRYPEGDKFPLIDAINSLPKLAECAVNKSAGIYVDILVITSEGQKRQYLLMPSVLSVDGKGYRLTGDQYEKLTLAADEAMKSSDLNYARWLVYMNPHRVTNIECTDESGKKFTVSEGNLAVAADYTRRLDVSYGRTYTPGSVDTAGMKKSFKTVLTFNSGVIYTITIADGEIYIESSDMSYSCRYATTPEQQEKYGEYMKASANKDNNKDLAARL